MKRTEKRILREYWELCKPRVVALMILTLWVGMALVGERLTIPTSLFVSATFGVAAMAASGAALNHIIDMKIDAKMHRTQYRPLPSGHLKRDQALIFALILGLGGWVILFFLVNVLTAMLTLLTTFGYGIFYTAFLKRHTSQNIVIGGLFGAMPPLLGWTAVANVVSPPAILLVLIIFTWTPAHFWALSLHRIEDYRKIDIPMLPITHGIPYTKLHILLYTILTLLASFLPYVSHMFGLFYFLGALIMGLRFLYWAIRLYRSDDLSCAMATFRFSNVYLMVLFLLMWVDHIVWNSFNLSHLV